MNRTSRTSARTLSLIADVVRTTEHVERNCNTSGFLTNHAFRRKQSTARQALEKYINKLEQDAKRYRKLPPEVKAMV